ncbi:MAG: hypothetical protein KDC87_20400 [Planctomycetes bacterium]|nr:hypothetical protein [Planctomycetota bacterium]MCB9870355.1 hypothetical protein [Planctomycetota bacterium]
MRKPTAAFALLLLTSLPAQMQLATTGDGGAVPGTSTLQLRGTANAPYLLLFSETETPIEPIPGIKLSIDLTWLDVCLALPPFVGTLNASGTASAAIPVPNLPTLYGVRMSLQSLELAPLGNVSNLLRITLQQRDTFAATLSAALAPIVTGQGFVQKNGKVLLIGGSGPAVQEYDPSLESFRIAGVVPSGNILATQTELADGTILVCGGIGLTGQPVQDAFVFDPATGQSKALAGMASARAGHAAALLTNGRVLVVGGAQSLDFSNLPAFLAGILRTSEIYDPVAQTFSAGPSLLEQKVFHSATTLGNGEVLVAGGLSVVPILNVPLVSATAQSYTPALNVFGLPRVMAQARMLHGAVALRNGKALLAGGLTIDFVNLAITSVADAVTYTPGLLGGFSGAMALGRGRALPALAPVGASGCLIAGGFELKLTSTELKLEPLTASDRFDGSTIAPTGPLQVARVGAVAVSLPDGTVLIAGGGTLPCEIYQPR